MALIEEQLQEALTRGKRPEIILSPGAQVVIPKGRPGRKRKWPIGTPRYLRYVGLRGRNRPYCMARSCKRQLRIDQKIACCPEHEDKIFNQAMYMLRQLGSTKEEILTYFEKQETRIPDAPHDPARYQLATP